MSRPAVTLLAVLIAAAAMRLATIGWGLPSATRTLATLHPDESINLYSFERMRPSRYDLFPGDALYWGTAHLYAHAAILGALNISGVLKRGDRAFFLSHLPQADRLYIAGRMVAIVFGVGVVWLVYLTGRRLSGPDLGAAAALLMAAAPVAIHTSQFSRPDSMMLFFGMAALYRALVYEQEGGGMRSAGAVGILLGLSIASKYSGIVFVLPVALYSCARFLRERSFIRHARWLAFACGSAVVVYIVMNPYILIRTRDVLAYAHGIATKGALSGPLMHGLYVYVTSLVPIAIGLPFACAALCGVVMLARGISREWSVLVVFAGAYILRFGPPENQAVAYCLPIVPCAALFAARFMQGIWSSVCGRIAAAAVLLGTVIIGAGYVSIYAQPSVQETAGRWFTDAIPAGSVVAIPKSDYWTIPPLKEAAGRYTVRSGARPQDTLSAAVLGLPQAARDAAYLVLSDVECRGLLAQPGIPTPEARALAAVLSGPWREIARFERPFPLGRWVAYSRGIHPDWEFAVPVIRVFARGSAS